MKIVINGSEVETTAESLSYEDVVSMARERGHPSVTWSVRGSRDGGTLYTGKSVTVVDGLVINCVHTGNA